MDLEMSFPRAGSLRKNNWDQSAVIHPSTHLVAAIVADSSSVVVSWVSSNRLLLSGIVESNPGPCRLGENPIYCITCSTKSKRGIQQETAPSCTETSYQLRCHQACNGLTVAQTCHAKSCGHNILWKCPKHNSGIAGIAVLPPPIIERPTRPSAAGKPCWVCSTPIRPRYTDLANHCANSSCPNVCYLIPTWSGFPIPRDEARQLELATRIWKCHWHTSTVVNAQVGQHHHHQQQQQKQLLQQAPP